MTHSLVLLVDVIALVKDEDLVPMLSGAQALAEIESRYNNIFELFQKIEAGGFTGDMLTGGKIVSPEQQIAVAKQKPLGMGRVDEVEAIFDLIRLYKELAAEEQAESPPPPPPPVLVPPATVRFPPPPVPPLPPGLPAAPPPALVVDVALIEVVEPLPPF